LLFFNIYIYNKYIYIFGIITSIFNNNNNNNVIAPIYIVEGEGEDEIEAELLLLLLLLLFVLTNHSVPPNLCHTQISYIQQISCIYTLH